MQIWGTVTEERERQIRFHFWNQIYIYFFYEFHMRNTCIFVRNEVNFSSEMEFQSKVKIVK